MLVTKMSAVAALSALSCFGSATISTSSSGGSSARMPAAVSAATLPTNSAFMLPPPSSRPRDKMQQLLAANETVDVARCIGAAPPRHAVGPGRAMRRHNHIGQFVEWVPRRPDLGIIRSRIAVPGVDRPAADDAVAQRGEQRILVRDGSASDIDQ